MQFTQGQQSISSSGPPKGTLTGTMALPTVPSLHSAQHDSSHQAGSQCVSNCKYLIKLESRSESVASKLYKLKDCRSYIHKQVLFKSSSFAQDFRRMGSMHMVPAPL